MKLNGALSANFQLILLEICRQRDPTCRSDGSYFVHQRDKKRTCIGIGENWAKWLSRCAGRSSHRREEGDRAYIEAICELDMQNCIAHRDYRNVERIRAVRVNSSVCEIVKLPSRLSGLPINSKQDGPSPCPA